MSIVETKYVDPEMPSSSDSTKMPKEKVSPSSVGRCSIKPEQPLKVVEADLREEGHMIHIAECCKQFHAMSPWADTEYDHNKVMTIVVDLIIDPNGVVLIHESGFILGKIEELVFGRSKVLYELAWWAQDQGTALLRAFEEKAEELGASGIVMASLFYADQNNDRYNRLFTRAGYVPRETLWYKER